MTKGEIDPVLGLKKQLSEKEKALQEGKLQSVCTSVLHPQISQRWAWLGGCSKRTARWRQSTKSMEQTKWCDPCL